MIRKRPDGIRFLAALRAARPYLQEALAVQNARSAPFAGLIGHSHMDTAWLWHIGETVKKCARTYSNQMSLMEQYPEYTFIQSSAYHSEVIRRNYPAPFLNGCSSAYGKAAMSQTAAFGWNAIAISLPASL